MYARVSIIILVIQKCYMEYLNTFSTTVIEKYRYFEQGSSKEFSWHLVLNLEISFHLVLNLEISFIVEVLPT